MRITSGRKFSYNGRKYYIQNTGHKEKNQKYMIQEVRDGRYICLCNKLGYDMPTFETIKDARRYVRDWDFTLEPLSNIG